MAVRSRVLVTTCLQQIPSVSWGGGIVDNASNAVLAKLNQIGTLSEILDAIGMMASYG